MDTSKTINTVDGMSIWMERYRPVNTSDLVLPENIKNKFKQYAQKEDIPNLGLWSNNPGCVLPGTSIRVQADEKWLSKSEIMDKYKLDNKGYLFLKKYSSVKKTPRRDFIDENTITEVLLKLAKSKYKFKQYYKTDKKYTNKFLKFGYWLTKYDVETAYKKVKKMIEQAEYFEFDVNNLHKKLRDFKTVDDILKAQLNLVYDKNCKIPEDSGRLDFWLWRGWTKKESLQKIKEHKNTECFEKDEKNDI